MKTQNKELLEELRTLGVEVEIIIKTNGRDEMIFTRKKEVVVIQIDRVKFYETEKEVLQFAINHFKK